MKKVCVIGLGYIGLPTALLAARAGLRVIGIDTDIQKIKELNNCQVAGHEPEIIEQLHEVCGTPYFKATTVYEPADYFVIAVPTPITEKQKADMSHVTDAAMALACVIKKGDTVILESTVPVGATQACAQVIEHESGLKAGKDFSVAHCPERVLPGNIFKELKVNDRVIGGIDQSSVQKASEFYKYFVSGDLYLTDVATAEMVKLIENSYRDVNIAFAQQVAGMAESVGLNPFEVIELANKHPRVSILKPSCGVGGHCIAVDPYFLIESFPQDSGLLQTAREVNNDRSVRVLESIKQTVAITNQILGRLSRVCVLGLTYKPNVDDLRESPALWITRQLAQEQNLELTVCDPHVRKDRLTDVLKDKMVGLIDGAQQADIIICLVGHAQFKLLDKKIVQEKRVVDVCGLFFEGRKESKEQEQFFWPASSSPKTATMGIAFGLNSISKEDQA